MNKKDFYPLVKKSLESAGFKYFDGDEDLQGQGKSHASKPDYIALKDNVIVIGEIKSPDEGPTTSSWRQIQNNDSDAFVSVRKKVLSREEKGETPKEIGGHEIIILGQIPDYFKKMNITYRFLIDSLNTFKKMAGYSVPLKEKENVKRALANCGKENFELIETGNSVITFIFSL